MEVKLITTEDDENVWGCNWQCEFPHISSINYNSPTKWHIANVNAKIKGTTSKINPKEEHGQQEDKIGEKENYEWGAKEMSTLDLPVTPSKSSITYKPIHND